MQLILESESTIDLKTKMSLSEDSVDKRVSDILPGVQNGGISNGDVTAESNEAAKVIENNDVEKLDQIKESVLIDTNDVLDHNGATTISETANIDAPTESNTTDIINGNNLCDKNSSVNSEPLAESHSENQSIERENVGIEETRTECNEIVASVDSPANDMNKDRSENEVKATEPLDTVFDNAATETTNIESSRDDDISENSNPCQIGNIKQEILDSAEVNLKESSNNIDANINLSDKLDIKQGNDETAVSDDMTTGITEDSTLEKEEEESSSQENYLESNPISHQSSDEPALVETNDSNMKSEMIKTKSGENAPLSEEKETVETTEIDTNDESVDLIRLDVDEPALVETNDSNVKSEIIKTQPAENAPVSEEKETVETTEIDTNDESDDLIRLDANEDENAELSASAVDANYKEGLKSGDVTSMDVDEDITASEEDKNEIYSTTPANTAEIAVSNCETVVPIENNLSQLDTKNSDDLIVNVDDDKEKNIEPVNANTESTLTQADDDEPVLKQNDDKVTENVEKAVTENPISVDEIIDLDEPKDSQNSKSSDEESKSNKDNTSKTVSEDSKPIEPVLKLSNTLDILSDDEDEQALKPSNTDTTDSKCINIEDDDDIMLIDDDTSGNESKIDPVKEQEIDKQIESKPASPTENVKVTEDSKSIDKVEDDVEKDAPVPDQEVIVSTSTPDISEKTEENKLENEIKKPLLPENFLKTCKKNLVDMTRDELEEFCVLKIVESILDRSNLSEIKNKLKTLTQNLEEYKKKAMMLQKQNRDLQVVFKSIQEDVKKSSNAPIVPLKITRSVGMQVLMSDKPDKRRRPGISVPNAFVNNNKPQRNPVAQGPRPQKPPTQPIPVPRLVPANTPTKSPQQVNTSKVTSPIPNGVKSVSPVQKGEKRTHNRIQSVTVDLTDDEPPTKIVNRTGPMPPVRLVPSQNLLAAPRTPSVNSPRKVYIPISGPQGQNVRPGQTIMLKTVPTPGPRPRAGGQHMVRMPQSIRMTRPQGLRHPAPLPECMKQYQPPNWKALPPAPDLKLAKVENGIVISWKIEGYQEDSYEEIASYQLYAYQETTSPPNTALWKKIGDVKALPLPMACTLTQFMAGYKYYFAVRAVDIRSRLGPFSLPGSILLLNKM